MKLSEEEMLHFIRTGRKDIYLVKISPNPTGLQMKLKLSNHNYLIFYILRLGYNKSFWAFQSRSKTLPVH
jgi:hypothetical protein